MKKLILGALMAGIAAPAFAATDGNLGPTSQGTLDIDLTISPLIKISGLDDITLNTNASNGQNGFQDAVGHTNFCVYTNNGGAQGTFNITATGDGAANAFSLSDGGTNTVAYQVNFAGSNIDNNTVGGTQLTPGTALAATGGSMSSGALTCNSAVDNTSTIWVSVPGTQLEGKPAANYTGVLTVTVAAN